MNFLSSPLGMSLIGVIVPAALALGVVKWKMFREAAKLSSNKIDDLVVDVIEDAAQSIVDSKKGEGDD